MHEAGIVADMFGEICQKGDDVVMGFALYLVDACDFPGALFAADFGITPSSAWASQACASISNQIRNLFSGSQMVVISGRL